MTDTQSATKRTVVYLQGDTENPEVEKPIVIGMQDDNFTEVISGLEEGDTVITRATLIAG